MAVQDVDQEIADGHDDRVARLERELVRRVRTLGILGDRSGVVAFHIGFALSFAIFLLRNFSAGIIVQGLLAGSDADRRRRQGGMPAVNRRTEQASSTGSHDRPSPPTHRGTGIRWSYIVALLMLAAVLALIVQNNQRVHFEWLWLDFEASLAVMLLATALATMVATSLIGLVWRARRRRSLDDSNQDSGRRRRLRTRVG